MKISRHSGFYPLPAMPVLLCIATLVLSGCATRLIVRIPHVLPDRPENAARLEQIRKVYLLINTPLPPDQEMGYKKVKEKKKKLVRPYFYVDTNSFIKSFNNTLSQAGGSVYAYRVTDEPHSNDPFTALLQPTAVIEAVFDTASITHSTVYHEKKEIDYNGNKKTVRTPETTYHGSMTGTGNLYSYPENELIVSKHFIAQHRQKYPSGPSDSYENTIRNLLNIQAGRQVAAIVLPPMVYRGRPLFNSGTDRDAVKAFRYAKKNNREKADIIWKERLGSGKGNWKDKINLAASAELKRDYVKAREYYEQAQAESAGDEDSKNIEWETIYRDMETSLIRKRNAVPATDSWFTRRVGVLPFSDETVEMDGPPLIRKNIHGLLKKGGYHMIPLEEIDITLRKNGFTQGGQLRATTPEKIAGWLNADLLLYGHIADFNKINIGIYVQKSIEGKITLWDAVKKEELFVSSKPVIVHSLPSEASREGVLVHFFGNLVESMVESIVDRPMANEAYWFAYKNLMGFPLKYTE